MRLASGWTSPLALLRDELVQLEYEGFVVSERLRERVAMLHPVCDAYNEGKLLELYAELEQLERDPAFDFVQPNELEAIRKERPDGSRRLAMRLTDDELRDRLQRGDHRPDCWGGGRPAELWRPAGRAAQRDHPAAGVRVPAGHDDGAGGTDAGGTPAGGGRRIRLKRFSLDYS